MRQHASGIQIVGISLERVLRLLDGFPNSSRDTIEFRDIFHQKRGARIFLNDKAVVLDRFVHVIAAIAISAGQFLIKVPESKVIVGGGLY